MKHPFINCVTCGEKCLRFHLKGGGGDCKQETQRIPANTVTNINTNKYSYKYKYKQMPIQIRMHVNTDTPANTKWGMRGFANTTHGVKELQMQ